MAEEAALDHITSQMMAADRKSAASGGALIGQRAGKRELENNEYPSENIQVNIQMRISDGSSGEVMERTMRLLINKTAEQDHFSGYTIASLFIIYGLRFCYLHPGRYWQY